MKFIPYGRQWIDDDDIQAVVETLRSDYLTQGPRIIDFEHKLCEITGAAFAAAVSNGTAALHAACYAAGIGEGDEVITTPMTFAASANCILYSGAKPIFADIDPISYNIAPQEIRKKITAKTRAIIPVHFTGRPCEMDEIMKIAKENDLVVIEDAAHSIGAGYKDKKIGNIGHITTFSFHPVKNVTTGEGGAAVTNDRYFYDRLAMFRTHGITRDDNKLERNDGSWYYEQQFLGFNYRMTDIQAALGLSQLNKLKRFIERRIEIVKYYNNAFSNFDGIITPQIDDEYYSSWHLYIIRLEPEKLRASRKEVFEALRAEGLGVSVHYIPVYYHPYYRKLGYKKGICPEAESLYERIITLPLYPAMLDEEVEYVADTVKKILKRFKK